MTVLSGVTDSEDSPCNWRRGAPERTSANPTCPGGQSSEHTQAKSQNLKLDRVQLTPYGMVKPEQLMHELMQDYRYL